MITVKYRNISFNFSSMEKAIEFIIKYCME
jgi:hypothetical protein